MSGVLEAYGDVNRFMLGLKTTVQQLFSEHGLAGWDFKMDRAMARAGCCNYKLKTISISKHFMTSPKSTYGSLWNIIWHELAHALTPGHKHNEVWRAKAIELGSDGRTHCDHYHKHSYSGTCKCHGTLHYRHRVMRGEARKARCKTRVAYTAESGTVMTLVA
jgi:hypothetical protein